jgi:hypothetical protein
MTKKMCFLLALAFAPAALATYKCVDEKGVTRIGETPPDECANVMIYEISPSGMILKKFDPTPTAEQLRQRQADAEKRKESDKIAAEQTRKDMALLNTYSTEREFDMTRDRNIEPIKGRIKVSKERLVAVDKDGKEAAAQNDDVARQVLTYDHKRMSTEKASLEKALASSDKEIEALHLKFDGDKRRWVELKTGGVKPKEDKGPTTITLSAGAAGIAKCGDKVYECPAGHEYMCREQRPGQRMREFKVACVAPSGTASPVSR